jgi:hypothetical protein
MPRKRSAVVAWLSVLGALLGATAIAAGDPTTVVTVTQLMLRFSDTDHPAPIDYGPGPGLPEPPAPSTSGSTIPNGGATAYLNGFFGPAFAWPIIPIHTVLLPNGQVMNYGTDENGNQGAAMIYDVWQPALGSGSNSQLVLPNTTGTDIFCSAQSVMWTTDQVLITGGDLTVNDVRNYSNNQTTIFSPSSDTIASGSQMQYPRWYDSMVALPTGDMLVLGGRTGPNVAATTPEVYDATAGWRTLTGATSDPAFNYNANNWYYPRGFVAANGSVFILGVDGTTWVLTTTGAGTIKQLAPTTLGGTESLPTVMYAPNKIMSVRANAATVVVDISKPTPAISQVGNMSQVRLWANGTVLPDGRVLATGGSLVDNELTGVAYAAELWNPATGQWALGASAAKPRLYHSNALLLPDATVLTGGGGAPGPVNELNAEIYYPSYLYRRDGSGQPATRPTLVSAPAVVTAGEPFTATVGPTDAIGRVTFVRTGSTTHSANLDQRLMNISFTQAGATLTVNPTTNANILLPGYYMMFAFNRSGVPSVAQIVLVQP